MSDNIVETNDSSKSLAEAWERAFREYEAYWTARPVGPSLVVLGPREYEAWRKAGW